MRQAQRRRAGDRRAPGANVLARLWAAVRGDTNVRNLEAPERWATWQRSGTEEPDGASPTAGDTATDRRD